MSVIVQFHSGATTVLQGWSVSDLEYTISEARKAETGFLYVQVEGRATNGVTFDPGRVEALYSTGQGR